MSDPLDPLYPQRMLRPMPLSAFLLGYYSPALRSACRVLYGEDDVPPDIQMMGRKIDRVAFEVLAGGGGKVRYSDLKVVLDDLVANYRAEVVADVGNLETFGDRREVIIDHLERVELLCERSVESDDLLAPWREVGYAIAALTFVLCLPQFEYPKGSGGKDATLRKVLAPLRDAVSRLPKDDATAIRSMLPKVLHAKPRWLADELVVASQSATKYLGEKYGASSWSEEWLSPSSIVSPRRSAAEGSGASGRVPSIPRYAKLAFSQFRRAASELGDSGVEDKKAYAWLIEEGLSLPAEETWCRYLRIVRPELGVRKNLPRKGRSGRSIVGADEV